jgi:N-acetylmuramic acid 6-phosphate etherase
VTTVTCRDRGPDGAGPSSILIDRVDLKWSWRTLMNKLLTEERNPASVDIDLLSTEEMLKVINREDQIVPLAVEKEISAIAGAIDLAVEALKVGGRLFYAGAGTSGRLGILDASESHPTFSVSPSLIQAVIAGGMRATHLPMEIAEDDARAGATAMQKRRVSSRDVVVGIAASGRTPYTLGAMRYGKKVGARIVSITCNPRSEMAALADVSIAPVVGPEVITGSTRMKAGTAQKLVLNMISTGIMIKLGHVYSNLMINVQMKNSKLRERGRRIIMAIAGVDSRTASHAMRQAHGNLKAAIVMLLKKEPAAPALERLKRTGMNLRKALENE